jgi:hypothetical protein
MAVNVYTSLSNATVYTDKLRISTGANAVTYQVYQVALVDGSIYGNANVVIGNTTPEGNLYTTPIQIPAATTRDVYCGAQNKVTVVGSGYTATELGTASSALAGVIGGQTLI